MLRASGPVLWLCKQGLRAACGAKEEFLLEAPPWRSLSRFRLCSWPHEADGLKLAPPRLPSDARGFFKKIPPERTLPDGHFFAIEALDVSLC
jgi:hypothetical protein